ncbi:MAG TPA: hypothetical protein VM243_06665 [Phycisphaerae bacterium]|nr:hypothetical protein [Phycisphaerae bacterium]
MLALLGVSTAFADDLRCPSVGGGAAEAAVPATDPAEASQFSVGHAPVGSVGNAAGRLHAGVMHAYVPPLYKTGFTWDFRRDYSAIRNPADDLPAIARATNFPRSNHVYTEAVWFYEGNADGLPDGAYDRADRGLFMAWDSWTCDEAVGPAVIDELEPPGGGVPEPDRGLHPMVTGPGQAVVHWHSPVGTLVRVTGRWINRSDVGSDDGMEWSIRKNADPQPLASGTLPAGTPGAQTPFGPIRVNVAIGDRIYFVLGNNGNATGDGATLRARVTASTWADPTPGDPVDLEGGP